MRVAGRVGLGLLVTAVSLVAWTQVSVGAAQSTGTVPHSIPFSMSQTMTRVQTLANGLTITHIELIRTMRDSQGRTRTERESNSGYESVSRDGNVSYLQPRGRSVQVTVSDPTKNIMMNWQENGSSKLVMVNHPRQGTPPANTYTRQPVVPKDGPRAVMRREDLGVKSIQGVYAKGTRMATTYPAGFDGNSAEYSTVQEFWSSSDLNGIMVEESIEGPEGKTTTTLNSFKEGEPDPALFKAPEGYTVWDPQQPPDSAAASK